MLTDTPLSVADVLDRAADLIEPEGKWTQNATSLNRAGEECSQGDPKATCWCLIGATCFVDPHHFGHRADLAMEKFLGQDPVIWNDAPERTQLEVVAALRRAATLARGGA